MPRDTDFDAAARALESRDRLAGSFTVGDEEFPLELREPTLKELETIEAELNDGADEAEAIRRIVDEFLEEPAVSADDIGVSKLRALFEGMRETWESTEQFDAAREEMPLEGKRRRKSRR